MPTRAATRSGEKRAASARDGVEPVDERRQRARARRSRSANSVCSIAKQQIGVAAGADEQVLVGDRRRLGAARIDDDQPAAARAQRLEPLARSRARSSSCRSRPADWRRARAGSRCDRRRESARAADGRTSRAPPACAAADRPTSPRSARACRAPCRRAAPSSAPSSCAPSGCRGRARPRSCRAAPAPPPAARRPRRARRPTTPARSDRSPGRRRSGCVMRSGSAWTSRSATAFGQMWPRLNGSAASPRTDDT